MQITWATRIPNTSNFELALSGPAIPGTGIACDQGRCIFGNNRWPCAPNANSACSSRIVR